LVLFGVVEDGGRSGVLDHFRGIDIDGEHSVKLVDKVTVVDETSVTNAVPVDKLVGLLFGQIDAKGSNAGAEGSLTDGALAKLVEVDKELLDTDAILGNACLDALLNVIFVAKD